MAEEIVKARVWTKIDTLEAWNANPLILGPGEFAPVLTAPGGSVFNFKVGTGDRRFSDLPWSLQTPGAAQEADTSTVFPTGVPGLYIPTEDGNYDGVTVDLSAGYTQLIWDGTTLVKVVFPIDLSGYIKTSDYVTQVLTETAIPHRYVVDSEVMLDDATKKLGAKLIDQSIKSIKTFCIGEEMYLYLRHFNFIVNSPGSYAITASFLFLNSADGNIDVTSSPVMNGQVSFTSLDAPVKFYLTTNYRPEVIELVVDPKAFDSPIQAGFRFPPTSETPNTISYERAGIKRTAISVESIKSFWGNRYNLLGGGVNNYAAEGFHVHQAVKDITITASEDTMLRIANVVKTATDYVFTFQALPLNRDDLSITGGSVATVRVEVPLSATGTIVRDSYLLSGNTSAEVSMVVDIDYLNEVFPSAFNCAGQSNQASWILVPKSTAGAVVSQLLAATAEDFKHNGYFNVSYNVTYSATDWHTSPIKVPAGATSFIHGGVVNAQNNVMLVNERFLPIGWGLVDDGTSDKYSGSGQFSNRSFPLTDPDVKYIIPTTTGGTVGNGSAKITFYGNMPVPDYSVDFAEYSTLYEAMADVFCPNHFYIGGSIYKKKVNGIASLSDIESTDARDLAAIDEYTISGAKIVPQSVERSNSSTFNGGTLCAVKDGVMYFYNSMARCIFKSSDGGSSFEPIIDESSHPGIFSTQDNINDVRVTIIPLENGELLIPIIQRGSVYYDDGVRQYNSRFWSLYRTTGGQTGLSRCFKFSHEDSVRDYLGPSDPAYLQQFHSSGCLLADCTHSIYGDIILVTEYGHETNYYWASQGDNNNGRGTSGRVWMSMDSGITWKKIFDADRKISGTTVNDSNWYYFPSTLAREMTHMHSVYIDKYRRKIYLTNGDAWDYLWCIDLDDAIGWYQSAPAVDPDEKPEYKTTDTFPDWSTVQFSPNRTSIAGYNGMRAQMMLPWSLQNGVLFGHDANREFGYMIHNPSIDDGDYLLEPTYSFERRSDYATDADFRASQISTDGFVQGIFRKDANSPVLLLHSGKSPLKKARIWATFDGVSFRQVFEDDPIYIGFGTKMLFDGNKAYINTSLTTNSSDAGYWEVKVK